MKREAPPETPPGVVYLNAELIDDSIKRGLERKKAQTEKTFKPLSKESS